MPDPYAAAPADPPPWHEQAVCRTHPDPDLWHSEARGVHGHHNARTAKAVCRSCPVQQECLDAGMWQPHGIWGGLTPVERRTVRRAGGC